jgi:DNA repair exonuclease SbcCD ATPase subunit
MPPRYDEEDNPLPRNLTDVKNDGRNLSESIISMGNKVQQDEAKYLITELDSVVDDCLKYEEQNEQITKENEVNASENDELAEEISEKEKQLDEQEKEIDEQLKSVEDELAAAQAALSDPPTAAELARIEKLENMKKRLMQERSGLQTDRERLQQCSNNSTKVTENCDRIRNDCNEVRHRIDVACNPPGLGGGMGTRNSNAAAEGFANSNLAGLLLECLREELEIMTKLRDYLAVKVPEIKVQHDENTTLLAETKTEFQEVVQNTDARSVTLESSKDELTKLKQERLLLQEQKSASSMPEMTKVSNTQSTGAMTALSETKSTGAMPAAASSTMTALTTTEPSAPVLSGPV